MLNITRCPTCDSTKIQLMRQDWTNEYQGETYTVPDLEYYECPVCGEKLYDRVAMRKIEAYSPAYRKKAASTLISRSSL